MSPSSPRSTRSILPPWIWTLSFSIFWRSFLCSPLLLPPLPLLPLPSYKQVHWQQSERALFFHFGMDTFTGREWGTGRDDPSLFDPTSLDAHQWVLTAKNAGFSRVILTTKHHDGFCLWPSAYTNYSVAASPWNSGSGDVVRLLSSAAHAEGLSFGVYLSPWDRHESSYGQTLQYNEFYLALLRELLTQYGPISEVWLDGAKGEDAPDMFYFFEEWFDVIRQLQPGAVIFSDAGPDARWVGNEDGESASTNWAMANHSNIVIGGINNLTYLQEGDINGVNWIPTECDVSIRPGWFWHKDEKPKSVNSLMEIFYQSVGRNCVLLLNVPPNSSGLISDEDATVLYGFNEVLQSIFSVNLAENASVSADSIRGWKFSPDLILDSDLSTYWAPEHGKMTGFLELVMEEKINFNVVRMQEAIGMGQRVISYHVDVLKDGEWVTVIRGTTIGYKRLELLELIETQVVRLYIDEARADPLIASFGLHLDPFTSRQPQKKSHTNISRRRWIQTKPKPDPFRVVL